MSHTTPSESTSTQCECPKISKLPFLDTSCSIENNKIITDLYKKETDRNQYLLTSSCHPAHVTNNIPFSLALHIVRICSKPEDREKRFIDLKNMLLARDYSNKIIDAAIEKARNIPRSEALKRVVKQANNDRTVFVVTYDPRLPSISKIVNKHYRTMIQDPHLKEVFNKPFLIAYKRPKNIRQYLIRSKVPPVVNRPKRTLPGMKKCGRCLTCAHVRPGKTTKATATNFAVDLRTQVDCNTSNVIYCIQCLKCRKQYIGQTQNSLKDRFYQHRGYVRNQKLEKATGHHFNLAGHSGSDMQVTIVEKVYNRDEFFRKRRESYYIQRFNSKHKGINRIS